MKKAFLAVIVSLVATQSFADIACRGSMKDADIRIDSTQLLLLPKKLVSGNLNYILETSKNLQLTTLDYKRTKGDKEFYNTLGAQPGYGTTIALNILDRKTKLVKETCVDSPFRANEALVRSVYSETRKVAIKNLSLAGDAENVVLECLYYYDSVAENCHNIK